MISRIKRVLLGVLFGGFVAGCSGGKLARKTASEKIDQHLATLGHFDQVYVGRIGVHCGYNSETHSEWLMDPEDDISTTIGVKAGYFSVAPDGQDYWKVTLSPEGQRAGAEEVTNRHVVLKGCDYKLTAIPVAKPVIVGVSGIIAENDNTAVAEYQWKWSVMDLGRALQENGSIYSQLSAKQRDRLHGVFELHDPWLPIPVPSESENTVHNGKATFKKYDDGWRLQLP